MNEISSSLNDDSDIASTDSENETHDDKMLSNNEILSMLLDQKERLKIELKKYDNKLLKLQKEIENDNVFNDYLKYQKKWKIKINKQWDGTLQGKTVKKLLSQRKEIIDALRTLHSEKALYLKHIIENIYFISQILWKKNYSKFNDLLLIEMKSAILNLDQLWHKYIERFDEKIKHQNTIKLHLLYHSYEKTIYTRRSDAWGDDEFVENMNQLVKNHFKLFSRFWNQKQLKKCVNHMLVSNGVQWDPTNTFTNEI